jgi:predicted GIY-YIG superfamily endonuclease
MARSEGAQGARRNISVAEWGVMNTQRVTVYGLTNEHGQICYVGQTRKVVARFNAHRSERRDFQVSGLVVLAGQLEWSAANREEEKWIALFGKDNLFNRRDGGFCNRRIFPSTKTM